MDARVPPLSLSTEPLVRNRPTEKALVCWRGSPRGGSSTVLRGGKVAQKAGGINTKPKPKEKPHSIKIQLCSINNYQPAAPGSRTCVQSVQQVAMVEQAIFARARLCGCFSAFSSKPKTSKFFVFCALVLFAASGRAEKSNVCHRQNRFRQAGSSNTLKLRDGDGVHQT